MKLPRLCFVGSMLGRTPGYYPQMGEIIASQFLREGIPTLILSRKTNRALRLADALWNMLAHCNSYDIVILQVYSGMSFIMEDCASLLAKILKKPVIMHLHGGSIPDFMRKFPAWTRTVLRRADVFVAPSSYLARTVEPLGRPCEIIPNVLDLNLYPFRPRREIQPNLLWMRAFHPVYNPRMALDVLQILLKEYPNAHLTMAGQDKGMLAGLKQDARERGISGSVDFPGCLAKDAKIAALAGCDIFLNTTTIDNTPVSVLEAAAMGLPVVTTRVGGIPDLLTHQQTAMLVESGDASGMASAVMELLRNPDLTETLSNNGRNLAHHSDWRQVRARWDSLFHHLLVQRGMDVRNMRSSQ